MLPRYAINNRVVVGFCVFLLIIGGLYSYYTLGRLEDPEFTVKTAVVATVCPGLSAEDVEERISDVIERESQRVKGVRRSRSISRPGISFVFVELFPDVPKDEVQAHWQDLRNKLETVKAKLPLEALSPIVNDDFGDVYGCLFALSGEGFSDEELCDRARDLQRELLETNQVSRVELWGMPDERIEIEISRARMAELNISPQQIVLALEGQNLQPDAGSLHVGGSNVRVAPTGVFGSLEEIENLLLPDSSKGTAVHVLTGALEESQAAGAFTRVDEATGSGERLIRLRDVATVKRTVNDEPLTIMRSNGNRSIGLAISPIPGGNVITMGKQVRAKLDEYIKDAPVGLMIDDVCYQPDSVQISIHAFTKNLFEAIVIVTLVVMVTMGWKSGLLITSSLLIVIFGTFCAMKGLGIDLHRTSLGSLIVALGILVDDAVVVGDLILVRMQRGVERKEACVDGARRAAFQLLGATVVGALAFWPVFLSPNITGEYAGSLFLIVGVSLMISWIVAMMQTPVVYYLFVKPKRIDSQKDPHSGPIYRMFRHSLEFSLRNRFVVVMLLIAAVYFSYIGYQHIPQIFFPRAQRSQFVIDFWEPQGSSISQTSEDVRKIEAYLAKQEGVVGVSTFIGSGPPRFYLPYEPELYNSCYAQLVVNVDSLDRIQEILEPTEEWAIAHCPEAEIRAQRFAMGPSTKSEVEVRFAGPDMKVLRSLALEAEKIFRADPDAEFVHNNWRQFSPTWTPEYSQAKGRQALVSRGEVSFALRWATKGIPCGVYGEGDHQLPIYMRACESDRNNSEVLENLPVWGHSSASVPLAQISDSTGVVWEPGVIARRSRERTITVGADPSFGNWSDLLRRVRPQIENIELPPGYRIIWGGQYDYAQEATGTLLSVTPIALILMAIIVVALFNGLRQPFIMIATFPLAGIGITVGMLLLNKPFGFMALIGAMSLLGMMVRNGVVLMDQIDEELKKGESPYDAIVDASVERMRPVTVAALTVIVGMYPLLRDPLFDSMATVIMFGLIFATILTLYIVPILYSYVFFVKPPRRGRRKYRK